MTETQELLSLLLLPSLNPSALLLALSITLVETFSSSPHSLNQVDF